jgi:hypothetical protein
MGQAILGNRPGFRQRRHGLQLFIAAQQAFVDIAADRPAGTVF